MSNRQQKCLIRKRKTRATIGDWKGFSLRKPPKGNRRPTNCRRHAKTPLETFCIFSSVAFGSQNQRPPTSFSHPQNYLPVWVSSKGKHTPPKWEQKYQFQLITFLPSQVGQIMRRIKGNGILNGNRNRNENGNAMRRTISAFGEILKHW